MVKRQPPPKQEQNIYAPYFYPSFSRYNYPTKVGGDEEVYTEPKWSFPMWDDEDVDGYTPSNQLHQRNKSGEDCFDYHEFDSTIENEELGNNGNAEEPEEEQVCEELQCGIEAARRDAKTDYDRFRSQFSSLSDELRELQREIEAAEAACMNNSFRNDIEHSQETSLGGSVPAISAFGMASPVRTLASSPNPIENNSRRMLTSVSTPSAIAMATAALRANSSLPDYEFSPPSSPPRPYFSFRSPNPPRNNQVNSTGHGAASPTNANNSRCLGLEDGWERMHQNNEWIRC